jgi:biopolymer transport protein ExbD
MSPAVACHLISSSGLPASGVSLFQSLLNSRAMLESIRSIGGIGPGNIRVVVGVYLLMAMRIGDSFGLITVLASLLMVHGALVTEYEAPGGVPVFLPRACTKYQEAHRGDRREVLVQYRLDHSSLVNSQLMPVENDLRRQIVTLMSTRQEQVISFTADERLSYGEVSSALSHLLADDPNLVMVLLTKRQVGSVDEVVPSRAFDLCL